ncbi:polyprenol phosphomannose-dependent alpha 1,6 mannosyltransferase MptB [Spirosoma areae]
MSSPFRIGWLVLSLGLFSLLGYGVDRQQINLLITLYGLAFWGYWRITRPFWSYSNTVSDGISLAYQPDRFLFLATGLFRLALVAVVPHLSDDYVRFIWDGHLVAHGYNPYLYLPSHLVGTPLATSVGLPHSLFRGLNSPDYYTVYPPVNQALFGLAAWLFPDNLLGAVICLRIPIFLADLGSLWLLAKLLRRFGKNPNLALLYGLNPLVILELTGNVHFEAVMIFFVLLAVWLFVQGRWVGSTIALALGIGAKLLPLIFMPLLLRYLGWKRGFAYVSLTLGFTAVLFLPFASVELVQNLFSSLNLYFQKFEFNASVYYLIRAGGYWLTGYNIIGGAGAVLFIALALSVWSIAFRDSSYQRKPVFPTKVLFTLTIYWLLATTVHPWYITSLVAVALFTPFRYPILWSGVIVLSYITYGVSPYHENLWLTGLEYGVVISYGLYEWYSVKW